MNKTKLDHIWGNAENTALDKVEEAYDQLESELQALENKAVQKQGLNIFTNQNIFENHSNPIIVRGNNTRYVIIANQNNSPILKLGRDANSGDGQVYAAQNSLIIGAKQNIDLKPEGIYQLRVYKTLNMMDNKIENVVNPTNEKDVANKRYVDALKTKIKEIAASSTDFNDFKTKIGQW